MNGRWLVQVLWGMVVVALLLAVASLASAWPVKAAPGTPPQPTGCVLPYPVCCYLDCRWERGRWVCTLYGRTVDPCFGYEGPCVPVSTCSP